MTYKLFLDDLRDPPCGDWVVCRDYKSACETVLASGVPNKMSLDHDLGDGPSGYDFAKFIIDTMIDGGKGYAPDVTVHSMNPVGKRNIEQLFDWYSRMVTP